MRQTELTYPKERFALISLLSFVEKNYSVLRDKLSQQYLVLHQESRQCLKNEITSDYLAYLQRVVHLIEISLKHPDILQSAREAFSTFIMLDKTTNEDMLNFQTIRILSNQDQEKYSDKSASIENDIANACAMAYLPQKWGANFAGVFLLQQELLCLEAWFIHLRQNSFTVRSQLKRQHFLCKEKTQFSFQFYNEPHLNKITAIALHSHQGSEGSAILSLLKIKIEDLEKKIQIEEESLIKHSNAPPQGIDYIRFQRDAVYFILFPPTLKPPQNRSFSPWLFNFSIVSLFQLFRQLNRVSFQFAETQNPLLNFYAAVNATLQKPHSLNKIFDMDKTLSF